MRIETPEPEFAMECAESSACSAFRGEPELHTVSGLNLTEARVLLDRLETLGIQLHDVDMDDDLCTTISWYR